MTVERFCKAHIAAAQQLAWQEYQQARQHFTALPALPNVCAADAYAPGVCAAGMCPSGACVSPTSAPPQTPLLPDLAPFAETTFQHVFFRRMGICCIESALASLASVLAAAAIGEAALGQYSR